jgi:hypothetical protein
MQRLNSIAGLSLWSCAYYALCALLLDRYVQGVRGLKLLRIKCITQHVMSWIDVAKACQGDVAKACQGVVYISCAAVLMQAVALFTENRN